MKDSLTQDNLMNINQFPNSRSKRELVIILPAYNERKYLPDAVNETAYWADKTSNDWVIVIAEDGSYDGTKKLAYALEKTKKNIEVIHNDAKLGRGEAVKRVMTIFDADVYAYLDVDLATEMKFFPMLINSVKNGYDIATGSRYIKGASFSRPMLRLFASKIYNWLVRLFYKSNIFDHQCGFKAFNRRVRDKLIKTCVSDDWFWDTEILIRGVRNGYKIIEFPVNWIERRYKKTPLLRLLNDVKIHGAQLFKYFLKI